MDKRKTVTVTFDLSDPMERAVFEWLGGEREKGKSGRIKKALYAHMIMYKRVTEKFEIREGVLPDEQ